VLKTGLFEHVLKGKSGGERQGMAGRSGNENRRINKK
jgi:hypothetical protein